MTDAPAPSVFDRVTAMVTEFIDWIGGRAPLTIPRAFYSKAQRHLCVIEDMLRGALYILSLEIETGPQAPKPEPTPGGPRAPAASLPRKATSRIGLFNIRPAADPLPAPARSGPRSAALGPRMHRPDRTTEAFLRRIARVEAAMADPLAHATRLARFLTKPVKPAKAPARPKAPPRPASAKAPASPRGLLSLQPRWPPG
tara:strand:- start:38285 stop:38881 length:597 start_codon:yes stop_codon:yes gene_type:complete